MRNEYCMLSVQKISLFKTYYLQNGWDLNHDPALPLPSGEHTQGDNVFLIHPVEWIDRIRVDKDLLYAAGCYEDRFLYERVDLTSVGKYLGMPKDANAIQLGDWWGDVREGERYEELYDRSFDEWEWYHAIGLTKALSCPMGTIGRAVEQHLLYDTEPNRRLDHRLFETVAKMISQAKATRERLDRERERRVRELLKSWGPTPQGERTEQEIHGMATGTERISTPSRWRPTSGSCGSQRRGAQESGVPVRCGDRSAIGRGSRGRRRQS